MGIGLISSASPADEAALLAALAAAGETPADDRRCSVGRRRGATTSADESARPGDRRPDLGAWQQPSSAHRRRGRRPSCARALRSSSPTRRVPRGLRAPPMPGSKRWCSITGLRRRATLTIGSSRKSCGRGTSNWSAWPASCASSVHRLLEAFPNAILNVHPSLLPSFPGVDAQRQALAHGVKITGATVHLVTE